MGFQGWLKPYLPVTLTHAFRVLATQVDVVEEETFRLPDGRWRPRELTLFIEAGLLADAEKEPKLREMVSAYVEMLLLNKTKPELHVADAISTVRPWLRRATTQGSAQTRQSSEPRAGTHPPAVPP
jgi:hypothetical protein